MLVGRFNTAVSGNELDLDVTRASAGGWVAAALDVNRANAGLGARQYLTVTTYTDAQFGTEADITESRLFTLTNLSDDSGYQYRIRRTSGDQPTSSSCGLESLGIGVWTSVQGGTVSPTDADSVAWTLFAPGEYSAGMQVQVINPDGGSAVADISFTIRIVYPA